MVWILLYSWSHVTSQDTKKATTDKMLEEYSLRV